jgi:ribosome biogenesis GTPase / thiamine phosphate phosphatase
MIHNYLRADAYANYLKMEREKTHFETSVVERRKKDKSFGKMLKSFKKSNKDNFQ